MLKFNCQNLLQKEALKLLINHEISSKEMQDLNLQFKSIDHDKNGEIGFYDLFNALMKVGINMDENELFKLFSKIHNEYNSKSELCKIFYKFIDDYNERH